MCLCSTFDDLIAKGKGPVLDTALHHDEHNAQERFTISEVAADWHELMIPQHIMWRFIARASEQMDPRCSMQTYHSSNQLHYAISPTPQKNSGSARIP